MALEEWKNLPTLQILQQYLNNVIDELDSNSQISSLWLSDRLHNFITTCMVFETKSGISVNAMIPDVVADSLEIQVTNEVVFLQGKQRKSAKDENDYELECGYSQFQIMIPLPQVIEPEIAIANLKNDMLTIILQKSSRSRQQVKVQILS
ncbi:MAG: Hsp20/alpha crystallin family protein [Fischerella sp. CENA71]|nr:Hsp20/alpha crystallin family protein [Fischerella sp. CENA71]